MKAITEMLGLWVKASELKPETGRNVLVHYRNNLGNKRIGVGHYIAAYTVEVECDTSWETDYSEDDDTNYLKEGWYETIDNWDDCSNVPIQYDVTHWRPLPDHP